ncbi:MAG: ATP-binding protein [Magnetococcales bacterium]|nr:ATP-binding protein [Magnetococcales bacterium]
MASAAQIKALIKSHFGGDGDHFYSVALQVAANEARSGHGKLAKEIRDLVDAAKHQQRPGALSPSTPIPIHRPDGELAHLLEASYPKERLNHMVLAPHVVERLKRVIKEQRHQQRILEHGLRPRRKLLLKGPPGTGKTMTASVMAKELGVPLFLVRLDALITKYMGETAAKLRLVFEAMQSSRGVYFFDEFDAIGSQRGLANDVGEVRRILNSFLQMIEQDDSPGLIVAATNHAEILDHALFRRFDDVIAYDLPSAEAAARLMKSRLAGFSIPGVRWQALGKAAHGLSHADIARACAEAIKDAIMRDEKVIAMKEIRAMLEERQIVGVIANY